MSGATQVEQFAQFAARCRDDGVREDVVTDVVARILDVVGNCLAAQGAHADSARTGPAVARTASRWGGAGDAEVIGSGQRLPAPSAALVNGTYAHLLDFDDTHLPSVLHPSANVVPAALAAAQAEGASSATLIAAIAAGIEITNRLGMASYLPELGNSLFFEKGLHATSICGTLGAAVAVGVVLGLDADGLASALGIAASMGAGVIEANRTGGTIKRVHCGWAAHSGVVAASLAAAGITGPPTVLEGRFGFFQALLDGQYDADVMLGDLGRRWELLRTVYKPYPSNHFTHPGIDCALALRTQGLRADEVASMRLGVAAPVLRTIAEPRQQKIRPESGYHAKFSGPFTVARALLGGGGLGVYLDDFTDAACRRSDVRELAARVDVEADDRATALFPNAFAAVLTVTTRSGATVEHRVDGSRGGPQAPLSQAELAEKFRSNAARVLPPAQVDALLSAVSDLAGGTVSADDVLKFTVVDSR